MQKSYSLLLVVLLLSHVLAGQTGDAQATTAPPAQQAAQPAPQQTADTSNFTSAKGFVLEDGIPVKLRLNRSPARAAACTSARSWRKLTPRSPAAMSSGEAAE
jgi:hypothetical protein